MHTHAHKTDLDGRRCDVGAAVLYVPVTVIAGGTEVARFRSPGKLVRAIIHGAVVLVDGDTIIVGKRWRSHDDGFGRHSNY